MPGQETANPLRSFPAALIISLVQALIWRKVAFLFLSASGCLSFNVSIRLSVFLTDEFHLILHKRMKQKKSQVLHQTHSMGEESGRLDAALSLSLSLSL